MINMQGLKIGTVVLVISFVSAAPAAGQRRLGERPELRERAFKALDANADGQIDRDEFLDRLPGLMEKIRRQEPTPYPHELPPPQADIGERERGFDEKMVDRMRELDERNLPERIERLVRKMIERQLPEIIEDKMHEVMAQRRGPEEPRRTPADVRHDRGRERSMRQWGDDEWEGCYGFRCPCMRGPCMRGDRPFASPRSEAHAFQRPWSGQRGPWGGPRDEQPRSMKRGGQWSEQPPRFSGGPAHFRMLDLDGDGMLQTVEIQRAIDMLQKALETSRDREISLQEWNQIVGKGFRKTPADRPPGRQADRPGRQGAPGAERRGSDKPPDQSPESEQP